MLDSLLSYDDTTANFRWLSFLGSSLVLHVFHAIGSELSASDEPSHIGMFV
jgi:hypothetical protein